MGSHDGYIRPETCVVKSCTKCEVITGNVFYQQCGGRAWPNVRRPDQVAMRQRPAGMTINALGSIIALLRADTEAAAAAGQSHRLRRDAARHHGRH